MNKKVIREWLDKAIHLLALWVVCLLILTLPAFLVMWFLEANDLIIVSTY